MSRKQEKAVLSDARRQGCNTDPDTALCCIQVNFNWKFGTKSLRFLFSTPAKNLHDLSCLWYLQSTKGSTWPPPPASLLSPNLASTQAVQVAG